MFIFLTVTAEEAAQLLSASARGDAGAFARFFDEYGTYVFRIARRYCATGEDAEDVTQEVFLRVFRSAGSFRGESAPETWLYRITKNASLDLFRKQARHADETEADPEAPEPVDPDPSMRPEEALLRKERYETLQKAIGELPEEYREALLLKEEGGLSYEQIASVLDCPLGTVRSRISRARSRLCELLDGGNFFDIPASVKAKRNRGEKEEPEK